jgi:hypothetical protein
MHLFWQKIGTATFWGIMFSKTHLVTLFVHQQSTLYKSSLGDRIEQ